MCKCNINVIEAENRHITELSGLWHKNFGDSFEYIEFFMKNKFPECRTIIAIHNNKIVASEFLMPVEAKEYDSIKKGYYLYALSVDSEYRNCEIGKALVEYACSLSVQENSFVILCPATDSLVTYYTKLGFIENAYVCNVKTSSQKEISADIKNLSAKDFMSLRNAFFNNLIIWDEKALDYALKENKFVGGTNILVEYKGTHFLLLRKENENMLVIESNVPDELKNDFTAIIYNRYKTKEVIWTTPHSKNNKTAQLYGMTYNLQKNNYYFNLILN